MYMPRLSPKPGVPDKSSQLPATYILTSTDGMKPLTIENDISILYKSSFIDSNDRNPSCNFPGETVRVLQFVSTPRS